MFTFFVLLLSLLVSVPAYGLDKEKLMKRYVLMERVLDGSVVNGTIVQRDKKGFVYILTVAHICDRIEEISKFSTLEQAITYSSSSYHPCAVTVRSFDKNINKEVFLPVRINFLLDIAVFRSKKPIKSKMVPNMLLASKLEVGDTVYLGGIPPTLGSPLFQRGSISGFMQVKDAVKILSTIVVSPGRSGSVLVTPDGKIAGILHGFVSYKNSHFSTLVTSNQIKHFMKDGRECVDKKYKNYGLECSFFKGEINYFDLMIANLQLKCGGLWFVCLH